MVLLNGEDLWRITAKNRGIHSRRHTSFNDSSGTLPCSKS